MARWNRAEWLDLHGDQGMDPEPEERPSGICSEERCYKCGKVFYVSIKHVWRSVNTNTPLACQACREAK